MKLNLTDDTLQVELNFWEQFWSFSFKKILTIPLSHIVQVSPAEPTSNWAQVRAPGTFLPGVIKAGTYYNSEGKEFWYATPGKDYLTVELRDEPFKRIVLTIDNAWDWVNRIQGEI
ncbi:hypothetical protein [Laspinema olomoucense]|uniref:Uncharacterized protein n=1 Tax=Laspinema olomoucense D3b TaxID=2953688 RepID=A0ABT2NBW6_9CYAN|nr:MULTISPECIES: hypothetical protein [unclassified Laspinema]MCT7975126.1 hypothetical protein [Laspinema sp. D3d]MCT7979981.1 hypothetical protein [Laspinema sp. D3b]MCT7990453.1 hypothetical protein [Laspinema sp. D3a]